MIQDATRQELIGDLARDRPPRAVGRREALVVDDPEPVPVILHQPETPVLFYALAGGVGPYRRTAR